MPTEPVAWCRFSAWPDFERLNHRVPAFEGCLDLIRCRYSWRICALVSPWRIHWVSVRIARWDRKTVTGKYSSPDWKPVVQWMFSVPIHLRRWWHMWVTGNCNPYHTEDETGKKCRYCGTSRM